MHTIKDILGKPINQGSTVITCHNGRIILGRIINVNRDTETVKVEAIASDTGGRRPPPAMKPFRRNDYNVFVVDDREMLIGSLKGYAHDTGEFDEDWDEEE
jgi:hypothetical protein